MWRLRFAQSLVLCSLYKLQKSLLIECLDFPLHIGKHESSFHIHKTGRSYKGLVRIVLHNKPDVMTVPYLVHPRHCPCCCHHPVFGEDGSQDLRQFTSFSCTLLMYLSTLQFPMIMTLLVSVLVSIPVSLVRSGSSLLVPTVLSAKCRL